MTGLGDHGATRLVAEQLQQMVSNLTSHAGLSEMAAIRRIRKHLDDFESESVRHARSQGATWQQIADDLGLASRQWAQSKFGDDATITLPGMSAAAMARRLGIHHQTVSANPGKHGVIVRTYRAGPGGRSRKRYFLPGDDGVGT